MLGAAGVAQQGLAGCRRCCRLAVPWGVTLRLVLVKMTAWVMVSVSYRSHRVSNFHSSLSTATKNCLMPCTQPGHQ